MAIHNSLRVSALSTAGLLFGAAVIPAGSAFAAGECGAGATLVADGICEVTFTETPDSNWTPPVGITKLQALLVGGGGAVGTTNEYGGGGGEVILVELAPTGAVDVTVGTGGLHDGNIASTASSVEQGNISEVAIGGDNSGSEGNIGGDSGSGYQGASFGAGGGASGDATDDAAGEGVTVSDISDDFSLFVDDDRCFGAGGIDTSYWADGASVNFYFNQAGCEGSNGGAISYPIDAAPLNEYWWSFVGDVSEVVETPTEANTGNGGARIRTTAEDGSDGIVVLRYDAQLASTGFDATGSLIAGAALVTSGAVVATRRRASR